MLSIRQRSLSAACLSTALALYVVTACAESGAAAPALAVAPMPMVAAMAPPEVADPPNAVAVPFGTDRPYGTPVPGGILIGADLSLQLKVCCLSSTTHCLTPQNPFLCGLHHVPLGQPTGTAPQRRVRAGESTLGCIVPIAVSQTHRAL